jgi:hypothetical protein
MAKQKEKKPLDKKGWVQTFELIGKACIKDYTFKIDEHSKKSDWIYNSINLNVDCGDKYGKVGCELMGGYGAGRNNVIYVHGKDENGGDDFDNRYQIDFDDRFDENILKDIGELCFIKIGIEKDTKGEVVINKFLHAYDAIKYLSEALQDGMEIKVRGQLKYTVYDKHVQVRKEINSIYLPREKELNTYEAAFTQSMLLDKYSIGKADKDKCAFPITAYILEKFKEYNGNDLTEGGAVKGGKFVPLRKTFEYVYDPEDEKSIERAGKLFKVKKNVTLITCQGVFVEGGAVIQTTEDDLPDDIKELVEMGAYSLEEALALCTENASKERRMLLTRPVIKLVGEDGSKIPQIQKFDSMYSEDDLVLDYLIEADDDEEVDEVEEDSETDTTDQDEEIDYDSMLDSLLDD